MAPRVCFFALVLLATGSGVLSAPEADLIQQLPGWTGSLPSRQYSGYLNFGPNNRKHIHYWYVESTKKDPSASSTPVVLWMNGGPGCSSLDGWYYEHGPFRGKPGKPTELVENPHTWANVANMLYIEAPVGVGFSYSDNAEDYNINDDSQARDNLDAMRAFFTLFPELASHPFYIFGESYGGMYVPTLAQQVLFAEGNNTWNGGKLHGMGVGNGVTGAGGSPHPIGTRAEFLLGTAFIPAKMKKAIRGACGDFQEPSVRCLELLGQADRVISEINIYDIYGECHRGRSNAKVSQVSEPHRNPLHDRLGVFGTPKLGAFTECLDSRDATAFFTQPGMLQAMHVRPISFTWATCATVRGWNYTANRVDLPRTTYPMIIDKVRVLIYNGDWDECVPYTDNEAWTESMGYPVAADWHAWSYASDDDGSRQVGGYATRYTANNFTFITVRGGRHEVPETAPVQALTMLTKFLEGEAF